MFNINHVMKSTLLVKKNTEDDCPTELRNIAAAIRLWGKLWSNINNIKICQSSCSALEEESKWLTRYIRFCNQRAKVTALSSVRVQDCLV